MVKGMEAVGLVLGAIPLIISVSRVMRVDNPAEAFFIESLSFELKIIQAFYEHLVRLLLEHLPTSQIKPRCAVTVPLAISIPRDDRGPE